MSNFDRPYTFDRVVRVIITTVIVVAILLFINRIKGVLLPFLIAWLLAYLINPLVEFCQRRLKIRNRPLAILATLGSIVLVIGGAIYFISPYLASEFSRFIHVLDISATNRANCTSFPRAGSTGSTPRSTWISSPNGCVGRTCSA